MFSSCGRCCCWCCGDCIDYYHQADVLRRPSYGQQNVSPIQERREPKTQIYNKSYGTYQMSLCVNSPKKIVNTSGQYLDYDNTDGKEDPEEFYQTVHSEADFLEREERNSSVVLDTKRISFQPLALYNKLSSVNSKRNWSLRQQPFFNEVSSSRMSSKLVDPRQEEAYDGPSEDDSVWSAETCEETFDRDSLPRCHKFPVYSDNTGSRPMGVPTSRMDGYRTTLSSPLPTAFNKLKFQKFDDSTTSSDILMKEVKKIN